MKQSKKTFLMYKDWIPLMKTLPREKLGDLMYAVACYQAGEDVQIDDPIVSSIFEMFRVKFDENEAAYQEQCEKNARIARERTVTKRNEPSRTLTDMDMDMDKDSDKDRDKGLDKESLTGHKKTYADDPELNQAILDFIDHRKKLKKPMTDHAIDLLVNKLNKITLDTREQIGLINTAIEHGWQTVYEPKGETRAGPPDKKAWMDAWVKGGA